MKLTSIFFVSMALFAVAAWGAEAKPGELKIDIAKFTCKELMAGSDTDREVGLSYYHGYMAGKKKLSALDVNSVAAQTDKVRDYCLSNPNSTVLDAFNKSAK